MTTEAKKPDAPKTESIPDMTKIVSDKTPGASADAAREDLEQRRTMLQNMKDFDFQIKKNQEDTTNISEKVESLSKDLDDLVSLYEIVSEQMNPFVGLSKVTKKRLDALENFTKEVDSVKTRIGDLESVLEKNGFSTGGNGISSPIKPNNEIKAGPEISAAPTVKTVTPVTQIPIKMQPNEAQNLSDKEMDEILTKSFEALLVEQNIDTMINDYFLSLK
jgi:predicted RNase H-like nuclease (RuvC/YqgF family)